MNSNALITLALATALLFTGCATQRELIEKRIGEKAGFFAALPPEKQQQIREGRVETGDTRDAAWIVYGKPDRVFKKFTGSATNEVWSYIAYDASYADSPRPVYHPVRTSRGRMFWRRDYFWETDVYHDPYEYMRIEFQDGRILSLESEQH